MVEPDNLVLEHLRAIRGERAKLVDWMQTMSTEMTAMRHHLFGAITTQNHDHVDIAEIKVRLDRIERLDLVDQR
jgi:hypothetical protein